MEERIRFIDHQGKRVLLVDFSTCPANEVERIARAVPDYVIVNPRGSVLVLTDFSGAVFNPDALRAIKETAVFDKPFVKKSALIGTENLPASFYDELRSFSRRELAGFQNPRGSFGLAGGRFGGRLSRFRDRSGVAESTALSAEQRKACWHKKA